MNILVVDDEPLARSRLISLIEEMDGYQVVGEAANGMEAIRLVEECQPRVVLMDIRMPGMDGMEAARHISALEHPPAVVFTTAYGEHALEAFEAQAIDYLLKPVEPERLGKALARARVISQNEGAGLQAAAGEQRRHICARVRGNLQLIPMDDVIYFQADQKYVNVHHLGGEVLIEDPLKSLEEEFGSRFMRVHRNALIASARITGMDKTADGRYLLVLEGTEDKIEVSRRHVAEVRRYLKSL
jgi:two-component system response regulator AlgR